MIKLIPKQNISALIKTAKKDLQNAVNQFKKLQDYECKFENFGILSEPDKILIRRTKGINKRLLRIIKELSE